MNASFFVDGRVLSSVIRSLANRALAMINPADLLATTIPWADRLNAAIDERDSAVCVGLDPRTDLLPPDVAPKSPGDLESVAESYRLFSEGIIDAVADIVPVVKPQAAFFEQLGPAGMNALGRVIRYAHQRGLLVVLDAKRNDIGTTAEAYAAAYLGRRSPWGADCLTVSPYLGDDSLDPFVEACRRSAAGIFVLVKTSNPGGGFLQDRVCDGEKLYQTVANWITQKNESLLGVWGYGPVGAVVGATYPQQLAELRAAMPGTLILIPGFGAQGGAAEDVAAGFDSTGKGAIVNNSRNIIFAYRRPEFASLGAARWQDAARQATIEMNQQLNAVRNPEGNPYPTEVEP
jgi:orotidine-5'-phosphate decarboxylase